MEQISIKNISMAYGGKTVLEHIDFSIKEGDYLLIIGENGTGKSTLIEGLLGLKAINEGEIVYAEGFRSSDIGYLPQFKSLNHNFPASVREVVLSGCLNSSKGVFYSREDKKKADKMLKKTGMIKQKNKCFTSLSGGQKQRVLLARALCSAHKMLLLDEPMASLDPLASAQIYELIEELNREGMTVVMVSHDVSAAAKSASHILYIKRSQLFFGTREAYLKNPLSSHFEKGEHHHDH